MKSKVPSSFCIAAGSLVTTTSWAPSRTASSALPGEVVSTTTRAPNALASFTAMCPKPPRPTTPTFCPLPTFQCRRGE
jgi:hypothetical protein